MTKSFFRALGAIGLATALTTPAVAQIGTGTDNTAYGGTSGEFMLLGAGARGAALGGAFAALATDVTALYYNPGGLAQLPRPAAMISTYDYIAGTRYSWLGIAFPLTGGARSVGLSAGTFGFSDQPVYTVDAPDGDGRTYSVAETFLAGTYAQNFSDRFSAGFSFKFISDKLGETKAGAFAVDFGTSFHATVGGRPIRAAFVLQNLGSQLKHDGSGLDAGVTRTPPLAALDVLSQGQNRVTVLGEFTQPNNTKPAAGGGLEVSSANIGNSGFSLAARASYTIQPDNNVNDISFGAQATTLSSGSFTKDGIAVGGGLAYGRGNLRLGFDYAWRDMGLLGGTNFLSFSVGW